MLVQILTTHGCDHGDGFIAVAATVESAKAVAAMLNEANESPDPLTWTVTASGRTTAKISPQAGGGFYRIFPQEVVVS